MRWLALFSLFAPFIAGCAYEYRPVSPLALPAITAVANRYGSAKALDMKNGHLFEVERGFDVEVVPVDRDDAPTEVHDAAEAGFDGRYITIVGREDPVPRTFGAWDVHHINVRTASPAKSALIGGILGGVATIITTSVVVVLATQKGGVVYNAGE
jgi:hypothetical protein